MLMELKEGLEILSKHCTTDDDRQLTVEGGDLLVGPETNELPPEELERLNTLGFRWDDTHGSWRAPVS